MPVHRSDAPIAGLHAYQDRQRTPAVLSMMAVALRARVKEWRAALHDMDRETRAEVRAYIYEATALADDFAAGRAWTKQDAR